MTPLYASLPGQWIAYTSDEPGRFEVYVRPFPEINGGKWLISIEGGAWLSAIGDERLAYEVGRVGALEGRAIGI
ncbi:MAG: hypothetical protein ACRD1Z_00345, partial [Vicinamibacteria bacterium]